MNVRLEIFGDHRLAICPPDGPLLAEKSHIKPFLEAAWGLDADWLVLPVSRLGPDFLNLRTGLLGEAAQTFVTYRTGLAIVGDITVALEASQALRDYVRETKTSSGVRFVSELQDFLSKLG